MKNKSNDEQREYKDKITKTVYNHNALGALWFTVQDHHLTVKSSTETYFQDTL